MSEAGLNVRCLASTRVSEQAWEEQELEESDENDIEEDLDQLKNKPLAVLIEDTELVATDGAHEAKDGLNQITGSSPYSGSEQDSDSVSSNKESNKESNNIYSSKHLVRPHTSCIQEAQLSPDGTCIFTSDHNRSFSVYPLDPTSTPNQPTKPLTPYAKFTSPDPIWSFAANPLFDINDSTSTHVLISRRDRYITLHNALWDVSPTPSTSATPTSPVDISTPLQFYKLINSLTEAVTAPLSLTYSHTGTHFFAGHRNAISIFDLTYADEPTHTIPTIPSARSKLKGGGRGFKGWISALSLSASSPFARGGLLTAGSRTRCIGIYDAISGEEVTTFSLPGTLDGKKIRLSNAHMKNVMGDGVSSIKYSPCSTYLYVAERSSDALLIYDVRNFSIAMAYCAGRKAQTKQQLGFDVWNAGASPYDVEAISHEIWAGGTDGMVRVWRDPYRKEGAVQADEVFEVGRGEGPVVGTMVHGSGRVAFAACGRVEVGDGDGDGDGEMNGRRRGGPGRPKYREWGSVDILGLN